MVGRVLVYNYDAIAAFMVEYRKALFQATIDKPEDYPWAPENPLRRELAVTAVADKMKNAIINGSYNHDGRGFQLACKAVGIPHTRKAIEAYIARRYEDA